MGYNKEDDVQYPRRTDIGYLRVEKFEPYELTHCIVFEMALRNKEVIKILHDLNNLKFVQDKVRSVLSIKYPVESREVIQESELQRTERKLIFEKFEKHELIYSELQNILKDKYFLYTDQSAINIPELENPFKKDASNIMSDAWSSPILRHLSYKIDEYLSGNGEVPNYKSDDNIYDGFTASRGIDIKSETFNISIINTHFKRKVYDTNQTNVALNMSLPEEELVSYIKHIKKTLSKKNAKKLKSPRALLGKEIKEAEKTENYPKKPTALKLADFFFVYDYVTARIDEYSANNIAIIINEIFYDVEFQLQKAYLKNIHNKYLNMTNDIDTIFNDMTSQLYRVEIKKLRKKYKKEKKNLNIDKICNDLELFLSHIEIKLLQKKYPKEIKKSEYNEVLKYIELLVYKTHMSNLQDKYLHTENPKTGYIFKDIKSLLEDVKMSDSTASNYYYAIKPYIEELRYPEFLTGESIIEIPEEESSSSL